MRLTMPVRVATFVSAVSLSAYACGEPTIPVGGIPASLILGRAMADGVYPQTYGVIRASRK